MDLILESNCQTKELYHIKFLLSTDVCTLSDLKFYQQVKLVNFIRRQIHQSRCYGCQKKFDSRVDMLQHIVSEGHVMKLPEMSIWNQPQ